MEECVDGEYQNFKAKGGAYIRKEFFGKYPELLELVADMSDDDIYRLHRGGHDPQKVYNAYKRAVEHQGRPHRHPGQDREGLWPGIGGSAQRHAPGKEAQRRGGGLLRLAVRDPDSRAGGSRRVVLQAAGGQPGNHLYEGAPWGARRIHAVARHSAVQLPGAAARVFFRIAGRIEGPRGIHHDGFRGHSAASAQRSEARQIHRPDRPRRRPYVRHGVHHPAGGNLRQPGPALQAARSGHGALLPRGQGRPDPGGRNHRSRLDGVVHRGRHRAFQLQGADDSVLHLLLDVRIPARGRPDLGLRRCARKGLS